MKEKPGDTGKASFGRFLSPEAIVKAHSPEAIERRRQTLAQRRENRLLDVVDCRRWGMVPDAIADYIELSDSYVRQLLSEAKRRGLL